MNRHDGARDGTRGQVALMFTVIIFLFAVFGAAAIDIGLLVNDRRDAQNDVDKIALAGALQLTLNPSTGAADEAAALAAADEWALANRVDLADLDVAVISNCYSSDDGVPTGVWAVIERDTPSFFVGLLGITDFAASADAVACAGNPIEMIGFLPIALSQTYAPCFDAPVPPDDPDDYAAKIGERCDIVFETGVQGQHGQLGIEPYSVCEDGNSSASVLKANIENGVQTICAVGDSVMGNAGANVGPLIQSLKDRMRDEGWYCEAAFPADMELNFLAGNAALNAYATEPLANPLSHADDLDDFYEIWIYDDGYANPAEGLIPYDCDAGQSGVQSSMRNVNLIVVRDWTSPDGVDNNSYIVRGFARVYLEGCTDMNDVFHKDCNVGGGKFTLHARFVKQLGITKTEIGLAPSYSGDIEVFLAK
jgi:hypothetical protein